MTAKFFWFGVAVLAIALAPASAPAAPALGDKPVKFEYAELQFRMTVVARAAILPAPGAVPPAGVAGAAAAGPTVRWTTGDDEVIVKSWEELAEKLKVAASKKDGTVTMQKLRVLNHLGAEGWEMVEHTGTDGTSGLATWTFKRRVP
jgi:hypothetical protein